MFQVPTEEDIFERLITNFLEEAGPMSVEEGTIPYTHLKPVSMDFSEAYRFIQDMWNALWVGNAEGGNLELVVSRAGIEKKLATKAKLSTPQLKLTGSPGGRIQSNTRLMTEGADPLFFVIRNTITLDSNGIGFSLMESELPGTQGNVAAGTTLLPANTITGLQKIELLANLEGGTNDETDDELRSRYWQKVRRRATSGNGAHYIEWALEVPGVTAARAYENLDGPNTVRVVLLGQDGLPPDNAVVEATRTHILAQRPLGPGDDGVFVVAATVKGFDIYAQVKLAKGLVISDIELTYEELVKEYFGSLIESDSEAQASNTVIWTKIGALLLGITGVEDYGGLTVNGITVNQSFEPDEIPVLGTVTLEVMP